MLVRLSEASVLIRHRIFIILVTGLRSVVNMGSAFLIGISLVGFALSQTQASNPLVLDKVRSARSKRDSRQGTEVYFKLSLIG